MFRHKTLVFCLFVVQHFFVQTVTAQKTGDIFSIKSNLITFHSNTSLELIKASSSELKGVIDVKKKIFAFSIAIATFDGFNSPLQKEHFNENYMETSRFPTASFTGHIIEEDDFTKDGSYNVRAKGKFTLHGITQERIFQGDLVVKNGTIKLICNFNVLLSEHEIKIPRIVHEKLASEIKIVLYAEFVKK